MMVVVTALAAPPFMVSFSAPDVVLGKARAALMKPIVAGAALDAVGFNLAATATTRITRARVLLNVP